MQIVELGRLRMTPGTANCVDFPRAATSSHAQGSDEQCRHAQPRRPLPLPSRSWTAISTTLNWMSAPGLAIFDLRDVEELMSSRELLASNLDVRVGPRMLGLLDVHTDFEARGTSH
jgi:hypothetical protein